MVKRKFRWIRYCIFFFTIYYLSSIFQYTRQERDLIARVSRRLKEEVARIKSLPNTSNSSFADKGIVLIGAAKYVNTSLKYLSYLYHHLKVEEQCQIFYRQDELALEHIQALETLSEKIKCIELSEKPAWLSPLLLNHSFSEKPFHLKHLAIAQSRFEHVLFLDSDNLLVRKPTSLFHSAEFEKTGLVLWSDFFLKRYFNLVYPITSVGFRLEYERETGQILVNKQKHFKTLLLSYFLTLDYDIQKDRQMLYGDKDSFELAARLLNNPYSTIPHNVIPVGELNLQIGGTCGYGLMQFDFDGFPIFIHAINKKMHSCSPLDYYAEPNFHALGITWDAWCIRFKSGSTDKPLSATWPDIFGEPYRNLTSSCLYFG